MAPLFWSPSADVASSSKLLGFPRPQQVVDGDIRRRGRTIGAIHLPLDLPRRPLPNVEGQVRLAQAVAGRGADRLHQAVEVFVALAPPTPRRRPPCRPRRPWRCTCVASARRIAIWSSLRPLGVSGVALFSTSRRCRERLGGGGGAAPAGRLLGRRLQRRGFGLVHRPELTQRRRIQRVRVVLLHQRQVIFERCEGSPCRSRWAYRRRRGSPSRGSWASASRSASRYTCPAAGRRAAGRPGCSSARRRSPIGSWTSWSGLWPSCRGIARPPRGTSLSGKRHLAVDADHEIRGILHALEHQRLGHHVHRGRRVKGFGRDLSEGFGFSFSPLGGDTCQAAAMIASYPTAAW